MGALPTATSSAGLALVAKAAGKVYLGSATDNPELSDAAYVALLSNTKEFSQLTPVSPIKLACFTLDFYYYYHYLKKYRETA